MKNSTLHRSNLTKERISFLENLRHQNKIASPTPGNNFNNMQEYERSYRQKELETLWGNFKTNQQIAEKSPGLYLGVGFIAGVACTLTLSIFMSILTIHFDTNSTSNSPNVVSKAPKLVKRVKENVAKKVAIVPADKAVSSFENTKPAEEKYTVVAGDTLEGIIVRFYGKYDTSKVDLILKVNNISNPNMLRLGQELIIPMQ